MTLFLPVGPPGSGKSFLGDRMKQRKIINLASYVSTDALRQKLTGSATNQSANGAVWTIARTMAHERLQRGLTVYFDATNLNPEWYDKMLARAKDHGHRVLFVYFDTAYPLCRQRNMERGVNAIPDVAVERMIAQHAAIDPSTLEGDVLTGSDADMIVTGINAWLNGETP